MAHSAPSAALPPLPRVSPPPIPASPAAAAALCPTAAGCGACFSLAPRPRCVLALAAGALAVGAALYVAKKTNLFRSLCRCMASTADKEQRLVEFVKATATKGSVDSVIETIDQFCWSSQWMMNVGDRKGKILDDAISSSRAAVIIELGCYCGYSSLRLARQALKNTADGARKPLVISVELNPVHASLARQVHEHAGVADIVHVVVGDLRAALPAVRELLRAHDERSVEAVFLDHHKESYLADLQRFEQNGLLRSGSVVVADNVICPGAPHYLSYVRSHPYFRSVFHPAMLEYDNTTCDGVEVSVYTREVDA